MSFKDEIQSFLYHQYDISWEEAGRIAEMIARRTDYGERDHLKFWLKDRFDSEIRTILPENIVSNFDKFSKIKSGLKEKLSSFLEKK